MLYQFILVIYIQKHKPYIKFKRQHMEQQEQQMINRKIITDFNQQRERQDQLRNKTIKYSLSDQQCNRLCKQIEFYLSPANIASDSNLRKQLNKKDHKCKWISISYLLRCNKIKNIVNQALKDYQSIKRNQKPNNKVCKRTKIRMIERAIKDSKTLKIRDGKISTVKPIICPKLAMQKMIYLQSKQQNSIKALCQRLIQKFTINEQTAQNQMKQQQLKLNKKGCSKLSTKIGHSWAILSFYSIKISEQVKNYIKQNQSQTIQKMLDYEQWKTQQKQAKKLKKMIANNQNKQTIIQKPFLLMQQENA